MAFDPVAYGQMLDDALGYPGQRRPSPGAGVAPTPAPEIAPSPPFTDSGEGPWAGELDAINGGLPMSSPTIDGGPGGASAGPGQSLQQEPDPDSTIGRMQGKIQAKPPFKIDYRKGALDKVKSVGDVINAMKPSSRDKYMDWWEKQNGAINDRWNQLQQELGQRPDPNADMSRKEQFRMLMEFGIELMRRAGQPNAGGESFAQAYGGARGRKMQAAADHDAKRGAIEAGRAADLKSIGSYGDALKGQAQIDENAVQMEEARGRMKAASRRKPEIISSDQGTYDYDPETRESRPITGIDGKPLTNLKVGARGGSAAGRDSRTANQKNIDDLIDRGVPEQLATDIVYRRVSDPRKMWADIYRDRRRQYASDQEAKREADDIMSRFYGDDWERKPTNARIDKSDPLGLRD